VSDDEKMDLSLRQDEAAMVAPSLPPSIAEKPLEVCVLIHYCVNLWHDCLKFMLYVILLKWHIVEFLDNLDGQPAVCSSF
jgi:hypothetical protein